MKKQLPLLLLTFFTLFVQDNLAAMADRRKPAQFRAETDLICKTPHATVEMGKAEKKVSKWKKRFARLEKKLQKKSERLARKGKTGTTFNLGFIGLIVLLVGLLLVLLGIAIPVVGVLFIIIGAIVGVVGLFLLIFLSGITVTDNSAQ